MDSREDTTSLEKPLPNLEGFGAFAIDTVAGSDPVDVMEGSLLKLWQPIDKEQYYLNDYYYILDWNTHTHTQKTGYKYVYGVMARYGYSVIRWPGNCIDRCYGAA